MYSHSLLLFSVALVITVATPGPAVLAVVSCAISRGFRDAAGMVCGLIIGDLFYFTLAALGMAALARSFGGFFLVLKIVGAAYLIWLGIKMWRSKPELLSESGSLSSRRGFKDNLLGGSMVCLGNPKAIAFYAGLMPTVVALEKLTLAELGMMMVIVVLVVGSIPLAYALAASRARRLFRDPRRVKVANRAAGTVMIGAGIAVAAQ